MTLHDLIALGGCLAPIAAAFVSARLTDRRRSPGQDGDHDTRDEDG